MRKRHSLATPAAICGLLAAALLTLPLAAAAQPNQPTLRPRCNNLRAISRVVRLSPAQEDQARAIFDELRRSIPKDRCLDLTGQLGLLDVYAVLRRARLFVGNDSGLMHLAAAAGCPTVGLFGPSDDRLYAPWGPHGRVVRGPRSFEQFKEIDPGLNQTIGHMLDLKVEPVVEAASELLAATS